VPQGTGLCAYDHGRSIARVAPTLARPLKFDVTMTRTSSRPRLTRLRYTSDHVPGITRVVLGGGRVTYRDAHGRVVRDREVLARIRALAIPPAWTDVWISPWPDGHVQATGRDARGRKQHRYHALWRAQRDDAKYARVVHFGRALPTLRRRVTRDLRTPGLTHRKVVALVARLLDVSLIRVGNDEYARHNGSFGLTTLRDRHVTVRGRTVRFKFAGKSGKTHDIEVADRRLARLVKQCRELPGSRLFQYVGDDGRTRDVTSADVNDYLRGVMGEAFTAKDFRTWAGTILAAQALGGRTSASARGATKQEVVRAVDVVARALGNTRAICRKSYVHPAVIDAYLDGTLAAMVRVKNGEGPLTFAARRRIEAAVLLLLRRRRGAAPPTRAA
jgi:DNA topoisomerase-1